MMCSICRQGETHAGTATVTLERGALTFVAKDAPAMLCANRDEKYLVASATEQAPRVVEDAADGACSTVKPSAVPVL